MTTSVSAIALPGAEQQLLAGVTHYPWTAAPFADWIDRAKALTKAYRDGKPCPWYGSERALDEWLPWLLEPWAASLSSCTK